MFFKKISPSLRPGLTVDIICQSTGKTQYSCDLGRRPGVIKPGTVSNEIIAHNDWFPTLLDIAGEPNIISKLLNGYTANGKTYKVHLDGYDQTAFLRGTSPTSARDKFFYSDDDGLLVAMRYGDYKWSFAEQRMIGTMGVWAEPFTKLRLNKIYNLMQDPYEWADITSNTYWDWVLNHVGAAYGVIEQVGIFAETFRQFPPRSIPPSFSPTTIMEDMLNEIKMDKEINRVIDENKSAPTPDKKKK